MDREQFQDAFDQAMAAFLKKKGAVIADLSGAQWQPPLVVLPYLNDTVRADHQKGGLSGMELSFDEKIICLQYLAEASGVPGPGEQRISFLQLPQGEHHYEPFVFEALTPLAERFANDPAGFIRAGKSLGGQVLAGGDAAVRLGVLPKISLDLLLWTADEEFPARAAILYDHKASFHLPTASLYMLGIAVAQRMIRA